MFHFKQVEARVFFDVRVRTGRMTVIRNLSNALFRGRRNSYLRSLNLTLQHRDGERRAILNQRFVANHGLGANDYISRSYARTILHCYAERSRRLSGWHFQRINFQSCRQRRGLAGVGITTGDKTFERNFHRAGVRWTVN